MFPRRRASSSRLRKSHPTLAPHILSRGGNAVDAAVATAFALAVTYPFAGNIGGGGFMVVRTPDGKATTFDYRERAPLKSTPTMYLNAKGEIDGSLTAAGYLAPGVPGTVRGMALAHRRFGKLPWRDVVQPAVEIAASGFLLPAATARSLSTEVRGTMRRFPASVDAYGKPGGESWMEGDRITQPDLARTLNAISENPETFYTGWIADRIADDMATTADSSVAKISPNTKPSSACRCAARFSVTRSSRCRRRARAARR